MNYNVSTEIKLTKLSTVHINAIWRKLSAESYMKQALILEQADRLSNANNNLVYDENSLDYAVLRNLVEAIVTDPDVTPLIGYFKHKRRNYDLLTNKLIYLYIKEGKVTL